MVLVAGVATSVNVAARRALDLPVAPLPRADVMVYGPEEFEIPSGGSALHVEDVDVTYQPGSRYRIDVENGDGGNDEVDAALLTINGVELHDGALGGGVTSIEFFGLLAENEMVLDLDGPNGSLVTVSIYQLDRPTTTIFGPVELIRTQGQPNEDSFEFDLPAGVEGPFGLHVNSGFADGSSRATAAWVELNSEVIFESIDFGQNVEYLEAQVELLDSANVLELRIAGRRGSRIEVFLTGVVADTTAPVITITSPDAGLITDDDSVLVTGVVTDQSAVTVDVNGVNATIVDDSLFSATVALEEEGLNVITATATDASSNEAIATVTVTRDNTTPILTVTAPVDELVTAVTPTPLTGQATDLNGVEVNVNGDPVATDSTGVFADSVELDPGVNVLTVTATDPAGNQDVEVRTVTLDQDDPFLIVEDPEDGLITNNPDVTVSGSVTDATDVTVDANSVPLIVSAGLFEGEVTLAEGTNLVTVTATDAAGNDVQVVRTVIVDTEAPELVVTAPDDNSTTDADSVDVTGTVTDSTEVMLTLNAVAVPIVAGEFETRVALDVGLNVLAFLAVDEAGNETVDTVRVTRDDPLPPDPSLVAPAVAANVASTIGASTSFLYEGEDPIQTGVEEGAIDPVRVVVVRGRVIDRDSSAVTGATVSILGHPEFGQTLTRSDGWYDMALNGGASGNVRVRKDGYPEVQRRLSLPVQDYVVVDDIVMTPLDTAVTTIEFDDPIEIARGSVQTDSDGTRQATLMFRQGTVATIDTGSGIDTLASISVRATEFTVGDTGEDAMPGLLPATSAFTYAAELSVDEAIAAGAGAVHFNQPVGVYLENFLDFPVGGLVPVGFFDREQGEWLAEPDGRVIEVTAVDSLGVASIDMTGDGVAEHPDTLLARLNLTANERAAIGATYEADDELWRVQLSHFTPVDFNWPFTLSNYEGRFPTMADPKPREDGGLDNCCFSFGSVISAENQSLGERVPITGTPFSLAYSSLRNPGRAAAYTLDIPLTGDTVPTGLTRVILEVAVAGLKFHEELPPSANQETTFVWNGRDAYGRQLSGEQPVEVTIGYAYAAATYDGPVSLRASFGRAAGGAGGNGGGGVINAFTRREQILTSTWRGTIGTRSVGSVNASAQSLGGWTLDVHHAYDPIAGRVYFGDGRQRSTTGIGDIIETFAGDGEFFADPEDIDGQVAAFAPLPSPRDVVVAADASVLALNSARVWRIGPDGIFDSFAGGGTFSTIDSIPADSATFFNLVAMTSGPDGSVWLGQFLSGSNSVIRVWPDGVTEEFGGAAGYAGDGGSIRSDSVRFNRLTDVAAGPDGSVYVSHGSGSGLQCIGGTCRRVRRIGPDGIVSTIAGTGGNTSTGDNGPATAASFATILALAVGPDGSVYVAESDRIRRISPNGIIRRVAGTGGNGDTGDGGSALSAQIWMADTGMTVGPDGSIYFSQAFSGGVIRKIDRNGIITRIAGTGTEGFSGDGGRPLAAQVRTPRGTALSPLGDLFVVDVTDHRLRRIGSVLPGFDAGEHLIASEDGGQLYRFSAAGQHLETLSTLTGETLYTFDYDAGNRLEMITDGDGLVTMLGRNVEGEPETITGPFGQETTLTIDAEGHLASIENPAGEIHAFVTDSLGLLTAFITPMQDTTTMAYDDDGRLVQHVDPAGRETTLSRTDSATFYEVEMTRGTRTSTYRVERLVDGGVRRLVIDPAGDSTTSVEASNSTTTGTTPDGTDRESVVGPDFRFGLEVPVVTSAELALPSGLTSLLVAGRRITLSDTTNPGSLVTLVDSVLLNGRKYRSSFLVSSRAMTSTTPEGRVTVSVLDSLERVVGHDVAGLDSVEFAYDGDGLLTSVTQGDRTWAFEYDESGRLQATIDPLNRSDSLFYDLADRVRKQVLANGDSIVYAYDANGNLTSIAPPGRSAHTFTYNAAGLDSIYDPPNVPGLGEDRTRYTYNGNQELQRIQRPDSADIEFFYDAAGRVDSVTIPRGTLDYAYSGTTGLLTSIEAPGAEAISFAYDGMLQTVETWSGTIDGTVAFDYNADLRVSGIAVNGDTIAYEYDDDRLLTNAGELLLTRDPLNGLLRETELDSTTTRMAYNSFGELAADSVWVGTTLMFARRYARDALGRIEEVIDFSDGATTVLGYDYDEIGRLETVTVDSAVFAEYAYDRNGNRLSRTSGAGTENGVYDAQDRLTSYDGATFVYNAAGELQLRVEGTDTTHYEYDALGNLLEVELEDGTVIEYVLDGLNRRIGRIVDGELVQGLLYGDQLNPVAELDSTGVVVSRFVYGSKPNVPDFMIRDGDTLRVISDQLGSVRLVIDAGSGVIVQAMTYDEWGRVLEDTNPGFQPFGYAGGLWDAATELVRFGARDYSSFLGTWTAKDPSGLAAAANAYAYSSGDPINYVDPTGFDGIRIRYDNYPINIGGGVRAPLGHGAVISVDEQGRTRYYEYGRYGDRRGITRRMTVPDLVMENGRPTEASLQNLYDFISEEYGRGSPVDADYYEDADAALINQFAEEWIGRNNDPNRPSYNIFWRNCFTFSARAIAAGLGG